MKKFNLFALAVVLYLLTFYFLIFGPVEGLYVTIPLLFIERLFLQLGLFIMSRATMAFAKQVREQILAAQKKGGMDFNDRP